MLHCSMYKKLIRKRAFAENLRSMKMTNANDFTKAMQDMMAKFPVDASAFQNAFKTQAAFGE